MKKRIRLLTQWMKKHSLLLRLIFFGSILVFVANQVAHIANGMSWESIRSTMNQQSRWSLGGMIVAGMFGVTPMLLYDWITVRVLEKQDGKRLPRRELFVSAWITNTINNLAGFGGVVGASLRANFYGRQGEKRRVLATVSKVALFMLSGLSIWAFVTFIDVFFLQADSIFRRYWIWLLGGSFVAPALALFAYLKRKTLFKEFYPKGIIGLFIASLGQWTGALTVFLLIGELMGVTISPFSVYPMFIVATLIGMLTMVPGGMGTFDVLMILGLSQLSIDRDITVVWLLYYRLFYYVTPFLTGIGLFSAHTGVKINRFLDNIPRLAFQKIAHLILVSAVYFAGIMMVLLSTITNLSAISRLFQILLPFSFDFLDQTLNLLVGFLLLGLARALAMKVKKAFIPTLLLLVFGILNTITRTLSWRLILAYLLIILVVWLSRKEFYREKFVYTWGAILFDSLLFGFLFIVYAIAGYHSGQGWSGQLTANRFILFPSDDVWFSGLVGLGISLLALVTLYQYLSTASRTVGEAYEPGRVQQLIDRFDGSPTSHYLALGDYSCFFYQENGQDQVMFAYQIKGNKYFILGDPIGCTEKKREATYEFMQQADRLGYQLAFYKVSESYIVLLHELGFHFAKVGETGIVDLPKEHEMTDLGKNGFNDLVKKGYTFEWYDQLPKEIYQELSMVSDVYLDGNREKQYSVGRFEKNYILSGSGGVVRVNGKIIGFITSQPMTKTQAGYDLLRVLPDQAPEITEYLLAHFLFTLQAKGYKEANLGLAPLAGVGTADFSFLDEKIMHIIYNYGNSFYSFQSAYEEKAQYVDRWEGSYFAYMKDANFLFATLQLFLLIGKPKKSDASLAEEIMIEL